MLFSAETEDTIATGLILLSTIGCLVTVSVWLLSIPILTLLTAVSYGIATVLAAVVIAVTITTVAYLLGSLYERLFGKV